MNRLGGMIILSGPSGVGKSTLVAELRKALPDLRFSISCTTRAPRGAERDGREYYFLSEEAFSNRLAQGEFIEHAQVFAHRYGTLKSEVLQHIRRGDDVLLDIDVHGALQIKKALASDELLARSAEFIFLVPPSVGELEKRLRGRATDSDEQIALRLDKSCHELSFWREYDFAVVNDDVARASAELIGIVSGLRCRTRRMCKAPFEEA